MPEGDTLHKIAAALTRALVGKPLLRVASPLPQIAGAGLSGRRVEAVEARGKNLLIRFDDGRTLYTHLRMHGSWHIKPRGVPVRGPRARVVLETADLAAVCFNAPVVELLAPRAEQAHRVLAALGPDILAAEFDPDAAAERLLIAGDLPIGEAVMDQRVVAGIGNVYKSELLFIHRIDPFARTAALAPEARRALMRDAQKWMRRNVEDRGFRTTRVALTGPRQWVYRRSGEPCLVCGATIAMARQGLGARSTYYCPQCQGAKDRAQGAGSNVTR
jgi:endonuclease-8